MERADKDEVNRGMQSGETSLRILEVLITQALPNCPLNILFVRNKVRKLLTLPFQTSHVYSICASSERVIAWVSSSIKRFCVIIPFLSAHSSQY